MAWIAKEAWSRSDQAIDQMVKSDAADARVAREAAKGQVISIVTRRAIEQMEQSGAADEMAQQLTESLVKHAAALLP